MAKPHLRLPTFTPQQVQRFWSKIDTNPGHGPKGTCWIWNSGTKHASHRVNSIRYGVHRISYYLTTGDDPWPLLVCHRCDWPPCVNPDHLFKDTYLGNVRDMISKGREASGLKHWSRLYPELINRGVRNGAAKLTDADVVRIRELHATGMRGVHIAKIYSVSGATVSGIVRRTHWKHIP